MKSLIYIITLPIRLIIGIIRFVIKTTALLLFCLFLLFLLVLFLT